MENDELKSIAEILALELPKRNVTPETALFTWHSDRRAWKCNTLHEKIALCHELRMPSWTCVETRLANLRLVRDRAEAAVARGISLLYAANHVLFRKYVFYGPHLDFHLVRRSVVLHLSDVLNIDFATLYPLLQQVCDIKHFLYFAGIHEQEHDHDVTNSLQLIPSRQQQNNNRTGVQPLFTWENLRHIWKFYVSVHTDYQGALLNLARTIMQPILSIQYQFRNLEKLEKHIDTVLHEGVSLLPGPDTDLWEAFKKHNGASEVADITVPLGCYRLQSVNNGPNYQRLALIRALKRFLFIADIHGQLDNFQGIMDTEQDELPPSKPSPTELQMSKPRFVGINYKMPALQYMYVHRSEYKRNKRSTATAIAAQFKREYKSVCKKMDETLELEQRVENYIQQDHLTLKPGQDPDLWKLCVEQGALLGARVAKVLQHNVEYLHVRLQMLRDLKKFLLIANIYGATIDSYVAIPRNTPDPATIDCCNDSDSVASIGAYSEEYIDLTHGNKYRMPATIDPDWESVINMELLFDDVAMPAVLHDEQNMITNADNSVALEAMECDSLSDVTAPTLPDDDVGNSASLLTPAPVADTKEPESAKVKNIGSFTLTEDQHIWNSWNQQLLSTTENRRMWMQATAAQLNRQSAVVHQRVNYLVRLEQQVNSIVSEGASLVPSRITELYDTYLQISGDTRVNCKHVDMTAAKRLQYALQPSYSVYSVLQEVKLVKWYLWLRNIHHDHSMSINASSVPIQCDNIHGTDMDAINDDILSVLLEENPVVGSDDANMNNSNCNEVCGSPLFGDSSNNPNLRWDDTSGGDENNSHSISWAGKKRQLCETHDHDDASHKREKF